MRPHHITQSLIAVVALPPLAAAQYGERYAAQTIAPDGLMPRFLVDKSNPIAKRAVDCGTTRHSCLDVGFGDDCCDNDTYCYVNNQGSLKCCPIGSNCGRDTECSSDSYQCTRTTTISGTATAQQGCCGRACRETSMYLCPEDRGGKCCTFGFECRADGNCVRPQPTSREPSLTPVVEGCTTSQFKCEDGQGCCDNDRSCTKVNGTGFCATRESTPPTLTNLVGPADGSQNQGLSAGAKAGIGVGVALGVLGLALGAFFLFRRRKSRQNTLSLQERVPDPNADPSVDGSGVPRENMTEATGPASDPLPGMTQDYFGPSAVVGPYTEMGTHLSTPTRAVPTSPQGPGDIAAPVEIGSTERSTSYPNSPMSSPSIAMTPYQEEGITGRSELYGSGMDGGRPPSYISSPTEELSRPPKNQ